MYGCMDIYIDIYISVQIHVYTYLYNLYTHTYVYMYIYRHMCVKKRSPFERPGTFKSLSLKFRKKYSFSKRTNKQTKLITTRS